MEYHKPFRFYRLFVLLIILGMFVNGHAVGKNNDADSVYFPLVLKEYKVDMVFVPAGVFWMGCDEATNPEPCPPGELPLQRVYLHGFYIDQYEVTNMQYEVCVVAGACRPPRPTSSATHSYDYGNPEYAGYPVVRVNRLDADNYCTWAGKRLPTSAEWEKAARGSSDTRVYPWGNVEPNCTLTNFNYCIGGITPVGSYPDGASPYGVMDMSGNVWEFVSEFIGYDQVCRGGCFIDGSYWLRTTVVHPCGIVGDTGDETGFRCAMSEVITPTPTR